MDVTTEAVREEMGRIKRRHSTPRAPRPPRAVEPPAVPIEEEEPPSAPFDDLDEEEPQGPLVDLAEDDEASADEVLLPPPVAEGPVMDTPGAAAFREAVVAYLAPVTWIQGQMLLLQQRGLMGVPAGAWERLLTAQRHAAHLYNELGISLALARPR